MKRFLAMLVAALTTGFTYADARTRAFTPTELRVMAAGVLAVEPNPHCISPALLVAFALKESSGRNLPAYRDGKTSARGLFAFHESRWLEVSDAPYATATPLQQMRAMRTALDRYLLDAQRHSAKDRIAWAASCHNRGHGSDAITPYVTDLMAILKSVEKD